MDRRGFTLVELIAVIVVIALILSITVPVIRGIVDNVTKSAFEADVQMVIKAIEYKQLEDENFDVTTIDKTTIVSELKLSNENYQSVSITLEDGIATLLIVGANKWKNLIAYGTFDNIVVESTITYGFDENAPVITLNGGAQVGISIGEEYVDAGATAVDDIDGDITDRILVTSNVDSDVAGYYTVIYTVSDTAGNYATPVARVVRVIDTTVPVITMLGEDHVTLTVGSVYNDAGATALDNEDGDISSNIEVTSTVNTSVAGDYTVTYNVSDSSYNEAIPVVRNVHVITGTYAFSYTGSSQSWQVPASGTYKIEVWGAQGGRNSYYGSNSVGATGGYSYGNIELTYGQLLSIFVGGKGGDTNNFFGAAGGYNGGGNGGTCAADYQNGGGGGGGASDVRLGGTQLSNRIIIAGGGSGAGGTTAPYGDAGVGGGAAGGSPYYQVGTGHVPFASGGTHIAGGNRGGYCNDFYGTDGSLGQGGTGGGGGISNGGGGGGGGYYGGGGGGASYGGGGGSGYIGGVTSASYLPGSSTFDAPGGGTETGHTGDGYVRITYIPE